MAVTKVETSTPRVAIRPMAHLRSASSAKFTCTAPANKSSASMPFISALAKSTLRRAALTAREMPRPGQSTSASTMTAEASSAMMTSPMVCGSFHVM